MKFLKKTIKGSDGKLPRLLITSGLHGNESSAVYTTMLVNKLTQSNEEIKSKYSSITFMIGINEYGLRNNTRETGTDVNPMDLNRMFYDPIDIKKEITDAIEENDIVVDVHNSPHIANLILLSFDENTNSYKEFMDKNKFTTMVWNRDTPTIKNKVNSMEGKMGFTVELNGMGCYSDTKKNVSFLFDFIKKIHAVKKTKTKPLTKYLARGMATTVEGMFVPEVELGADVKMNQKLGTIYDFDNNVLEEITSSVNGKVIVLPDGYFVNRSEEIINVQP